MTKMWIRTWDNERKEVDALDVRDDLFVALNEVTGRYVVTTKGGFSMCEGDSIEGAWAMADQVMTDNPTWRERVAQLLASNTPLMDCLIEYVLPEPNPVPDDWEARLAHLWSWDVLDTIRNCYIQTTGEEYKTCDLLTIIDDWRTVHIIETLMVVALDNLHLYAHAFEETERQGNKVDWIEVEGSKYPLITDLRLSRHGLFPMDEMGDHQHGSPYLVPSVIEDVQDGYFKEHWGEIVFSDEYTQCSNCTHILRTSPDSYNREPEFYLGDGEILCPDCVDVDDALENLNHSRKPLPEFIQRTAESDGKIVVLQHEWENGWHSGMDDDPEKIEVWLKQQGIQDWWWDVDPSQFYVTFRLILRPEDVLKLEDIFRDQLDEDEGIETLLSNINAYQGYSGSQAMSDALQHGSNEHVRVTKTTFDSEGNLIVEEQ